MAGFKLPYIKNVTNYVFYYSLAQEPDYEQVAYVLEPLYEFF